MTLTVKFHEFMQKINFLEKPAEKIQTFLKNNPNFFKVVLVVNHIFRALAMLFMMTALPFSPIINIGLGFVASFLYRLTVENNCAFKFALPAFAGGITLSLANIGLIDFVSGLAFTSLQGFALAAGCFIPLIGYTIYIILTVSHEVNQNCLLKTVTPSCCSI